MPTLAFLAISLSRINARLQEGMAIFKIIARFLRSADQ